MDQNEQKKLWEKCVAFHGHACGGLTIGYKAALYAIELLGLTFSDDEEVVCISENDACGVDALQVILGCSAGKGNLLFHMTIYPSASVTAGMFDTMETRLRLPEPARLFRSLPCEGCGEITAEHLLRIENGKKLCLDCCHPYDRFHV